MREQLGSGTARVPDLPQYIIGKLGLNKNLLTDEADGGEMSPEEAEKVAQQSAAKTDDELTKALVPDAPKEEDYESIRVRSRLTMDAHIGLTAHCELLTLGSWPTVSCSPWAHGSS